MASVNKVIIVGNLGADPEVKTFDNGGKIANISVATTDRWTDRNTGEQREATEWHRITFNDRLADIVAQYLRKGSQVYVEGSLRTRKWTDQQGIERYTTEIRATSMQMLGSRQGGNDGYQGGGYQNNYQGNPQGGYNSRPQNNYPQNNYAHNTPQNGYPQNNFAHNAPQNFNQGGQMGGCDDYSQEQNFAPPAPTRQAPPANNFGSPNTGNANNAPKPMTDTSSQIQDDDMPF